MSSRMTVLGGSGAWPEPGRACSGFLVEHDGFRAVLDLGYGTLPRLLEFLDSVHADGLDAVVVTHEHPDHAIDLHGLFRARWFGRRDGPAIPLYAGAGVLDAVARVEQDDVTTLQRVFDWHELPAAPYEVGPFRLSSWALPHFVPNAGVRLTAPGLTIAYTGDTGPDPALIDLARNADVFIAEASDRDQQPHTPPAPPGRRLHLNSRDAAEVAAEAGVRKLLLTHFWPGNDRETSRAAAAELFDGDIAIADDGLELPLP